MLSLREITNQLNVATGSPSLLRSKRFDSGMEFTERRDTLQADLAAETLPVSDLLEVVKQGLQVAGQLEFSTVPPYLVALWSVIDESHPVARSLRAIVHEEMLHMALANNMLSAIGGVPLLTGAATPRYPTSLPGGVHPELVVSLSGLTDSSLDVFLEIERPVVGVPVDGFELPKPPDEDSTISEFYEAVKRQLRELRPDFSIDRQVAGPLAPMVVASLDDCDKAVEIILTQGEGAKGGPLDTGPGDLAHYYRFLEVRLGHRLVWDEARRVLQKVEVIKAPSVYPVASAPSAGWGRAAPARIRWLSAEFNRLYSELLDLLEQSWRDGGHRAFLGGLERMFGMRELAREMIRTPGPGGVGYSPEFKYLGLDER